MNFKIKLALSIVILTVIVCICTNVQAAEFTSRILNGTNVTLKGYNILKNTEFKSTEGTTTTNNVSNLDFSKPPYTFSKILTEAEVGNSKNLFCAEPDVPLGNNTTYTGDGNLHSFSNDKWAWVLSELETNKKDLANSTVQKAIWKLLNSNKGEANSVYRTAEVYEEYRKEYKDPTFESIDAKANVEGSGYKVGPFKVTYVSKHYGDTYFGNINSAKVVDRNGNEIPSTDWSFQSEDGTTIKYPESGKPFYIIINSLTVQGPINVDLGFNTVEATGNYVTLTGKYHVAPWKNTFYCDDCQKKAEKYSLDGDDLYEVKSTTVRCGSYVSDTDSGSTGHSLEKHYYYCYTEYEDNSGLSNTTGTKKCKGEYCNGNNSHTVSFRNYVGKYGCDAKIIRGEFYSIKYGEVTSTVRCGYHYDVPGHDQKGQDLYYAWGNRSMPNATLTAEIELNSIDLSLRKFISAVNDTALDVDRTPSVDTTILDKEYNKAPETATYTHPKNPVEVAWGDIVTYTIRVYNEGSDVVTYAKEIKDYLPEYLEFVNNDFNKDYGWKVSGDGRVVTTTYLADKPLEKYVIGSGTLSYQDVKIQCKVLDKAPQKQVIINKAEISKYAFEQGGIISEIERDRDSIAGNIDINNYNPPADNSRYQEDDDDYEQVILARMDDLSLRKFIVAVNDDKPLIDEVESDRTPSVNPEVLNKNNNRVPETATYTHPKDPVDVARGDIVTYTIRVYNEGSDLDSFAREIKDYLPDYLEFINNDFNKSYGWSADGKVVTTSYLKNTKLNKYVIGSNKLSYADVKIQCKVSDNTPYNQILVNKAEISLYGHEQQNGKIYELKKDRDSIADNIDINNYNPPADNSKYQEDDDDYEQLKLAITDFAGEVWLDGLEGKQEERNNILDENDKPFANIRVILHNNTKTKDLETTTDENGKYVFKRQQINNNYYVSFEYQGQEYMPVEPDGFVEFTSANYKDYNSAAKERIVGEDAYRGTLTREELNAKFYEIVKGAGENKGLAVNKNNSTSTIELEYTGPNASKHSSEINKNTDIFINATKIQSHTVNFDGTADHTKHINLGLFERAQINLGLMTDVNSVDLTINGKNTTYDYSQRDEKTAVDINAKIADSSRVYNQALYKSDYNFRISDYNNESKTVKVEDQSKELEVYATYKIKVKNNSSKDASVSELKLYADKTYKYLNSWYAREANGNNGEVTWAAGEKIGDFNTMKTSSIKGVNIAPNEEVYVYVRFQVVKDDPATRNILLGTKYIVAEISKYTTPEGLIDTKSQPDNVDVTDWDKYVATMEQDTDRAPGLNIYVDEGLVRKMTGFVFEDAVIHTEDTKDVEIGNGIFESGEKLYNNVIVQLIEKVKIGDATYEYIWQEGLTGTNTVSYMDKTGTLQEHNNARNVGDVSEGYYRFTEYIPGDYIVRFRYGDTVVGEKVVLSGQDYKYTENKGFGDNLSSADDNPYRRLETMNFSLEQSYIKSAILSNDPTTWRKIDAEDMKNFLDAIPENERNIVKVTDAGGSINVVATAQKILRYYTWMNADTTNFAVEIKDEHPATMINFGVILRPKAELKAEKTIVGVKITNKGTVQVDTENGIGEPLVAPYRERQFQIDDEYIQGAVLEIKYEIKVTNVGENDSLYNYFKGNTVGGKLQGIDQNALTKTSALLIFDYPQNIGFSSTTNSNWKEVSADELNSLSKQARSIISTNKTLAKAKPTDAAIYQELEVGDSAKTQLVLSRVLSVETDEKMIYNNSVEIVAVKNTVGRKTEKSTLGNYKPIEGDSLKPPTPDEPDTDATSITVVTPQGAPKPNPHYEIWISGIAILIVGIILIKTVVLRKKE